MKALALRHVPFEDLGTLAPLLEARGFETAYAEVPALGAEGIAGLDPLAPDLLVVLGGPIGVYEAEAYPFLVTETALIGRRLSADRPTLGLCLGCQLMARALGSRVYPSGTKEIGWAPVELTEAGRASPLAPLGEPSAEVLHWHGDTFDLPKGAVHLASTGAVRNQAFSVGAHALALQFHPEVTAHGLEAWLVGHACEIAATDGVAVETLRADAGRAAGPAAERAARIFTSWMDAAGL